MVLQYVLINIIYKHSTMLENFDSVVLYMVGSTLQLCVYALDYI